MTNVKVQRKGVLDKKEWDGMFDRSIKNQVSIFTVYKVKHALDLEREQTAWNYINRYATETIGTDEGLDEIA